MVQGHVDCGVMQETKLIDGVYTRESSSFWVMEIAAGPPNGHCGGVTVLYGKTEHFAIEEIRLHVQNTIGFLLMIGRRRWHIVGCYIAPRDAPTIEDAVAVSRD